MPKLIASALLTAALAIGVAGCGDDGDDGVPTGDVSKQRYVAEADAVCARANRELRQAANEAFADLAPSQSPPDSELETFGEEVVIPNIQGQLDALGEIEAPQADAETINEFLDTAQEELDAVAEDLSSFSRRDADPLAGANRLARAYGLKVCGAG